MKHSKATKLINERLERRGAIHEALTKREELVFGRAQKALGDLKNLLKAKGVEDRWAVQNALIEITRLYWSIKNGETPWD